MFYKEILYPQFSFILTPTLTAPPFSTFNLQRLIAYQTLKFYSPFQKAFIIYIAAVQSEFLESFSRRNLFDLYNLHSFDLVFMLFQCYFIIYLYFFFSFLNNLSCKSILLTNRPFFPITKKKLYTIIHCVKINIFLCSKCINGSNEFHL